jgi:hypothetical protein
MALSDFSHKSKFFLNLAPLVAGGVRNFDPNNESFQQATAEAKEAGAGAFAIGNCIAGGLLVGGIRIDLWVMQDYEGLYGSGQVKIDFSAALVGAQIGVVDSFVYGFLYGYGRDIKLLPGDCSIQHTALTIPPVPKHFGFLNLSKEHLGFFNRGIFGALGPGRGFIFHTTTVGGKLSVSIQ